MVDVHFVDHGQVEVILNNRLHDVPGEVRVPLDVRHRARPPAFVGGFELLSATNGKRRKQVKAER